MEVVKHANRNNRIVSAAGVPSPSRATALKDQALANPMQYEQFLLCD
jgi:hypothetical protein